MTKDKIQVSIRRVSDFNGISFGSAFAEIPIHSTSEFFLATAIHKPGLKN